MTHEAQLSHLAMRLAPRTPHLTQANHTLVLVGPPLSVGPGLKALAVAAALLAAFSAF